MRTFSGSAAALVACLAVSIALGQQRVDPYGPNPNDPYTIGATITPDGRSFTVHVTVTEKKTGAIVFAPTVSTQANVPAEILSDPSESQPQFKVHVEMNAAGKATITFEAFQRMLQRSHVRAVAEPPRQESAHSRR